MNRLLQGDGGRAKPPLPFLLRVCRMEKRRAVRYHGAHGILAQQQHFSQPLRHFSGDTVRVYPRRNACRRQERGGRKIASGKAGGDSGALMRFSSEKTEYRDLRMVVTDEQHRFGVAHRRGLRARGKPAPLVMSATPIPRTLALVLYSDL